MVVIELLPMKPQFLTLKCYSSLLRMNVPPKDLAHHTLFTRLCKYE